MTTASSSSSSSGQTPPADDAMLLLKKEVFTAYLQPLLKKHETGTLLQYEDLTSSWQAAIATLGRASSSAAAEENSSAPQKEYVSAVVSIVLL